MRFRLCIVCLLFATVALAKEPPAAKLSIRVVVTTTPPEVFASRGDKPNDGGDVVAVKVPKRGELVSAVVLFSDCAANAKGQCDAELDMVVREPSGGVYGQFAESELWRNKVPPASGKRQLGVGYMQMVIEPGEPSGHYRVEVVVRDKVSGRTVKAKSGFTIE